MSHESTCPDPESLSRFLSGHSESSVTPGSTSTIEEHLGECAICRRHADAFLDAETVGTAVRDSAVDLIDVPESPPGYELIEELGRGGQGIVHVAVQESTGRRVAVKIVAARGKKNRRRMEREFESVRRLEHANIVRLYDSGELKDGRWLAMELLSGTHLDRWFAANADLEGRVAVLTKVANAIHHAHQKGVVHRDLKPSNILVDESGEPHVLDFGLGRHDDAAPLTLTGEFAGTLRFAAPEQLEGRSDAVDPRTDVYAIGLLLYLAVTEVHPFAEQDGIKDLIRAVTTGDVPRPARYVPAVDRDLESIVLKALAADPTDRYQSAEALAADLVGWSRGDPVVARGAGPGYQLFRVLRRHRILVTFAATLLIVIGASSAALLGVLEHSEEIDEERLLLDDLVRAGRLIKESDDLWPSERNRAALGRWLTTANDLLTREADYTAQLEELRSSALPVTDDDRRRGHPNAWRRRDRLARDLAVLTKKTGRRDRRRADRLEEQISDLEDAMNVRKAWSYASSVRTWEDERLSGLLHRFEQLRRHRESVRWRLERTRADEERDLWEAAISDIAERSEYDGLELTRRDDLVPLGANPGTRLWEFWHPASGERPVWDDDADTWIIRPETGLVFVLLPPKVLRGGPADMMKMRVAAVFIARYPITTAMSARVLANVPAPDAADATRPVIDLSTDDASDLLLRLDVDIASDLDIVRAHGGPPSFDGTDSITFPAKRTRKPPAPVSELPANELGLHGLGKGMELQRVARVHMFATPESDEPDIVVYGGADGSGMFIPPGLGPAPMHQWVRPALRIR